jgi:hypothetical protein
MSHFTSAACVLLRLLYLSLTPELRQLSIYLDEEKASITPGIPMDLPVAASMEMLVHNSIVEGDNLGTTYRRLHQQYLRLIEKSKYRRFCSGVDKFQDNFGL